MSAVEAADELGAALRTALAACGQGALDAASAALDRAARIAPGHPDLLHLRGMVAMGRGAAGEAIAWFERATAAAPATALYWNNLGYAHRQSGDLGAAQAALVRAIALDPGYGAAHNNLGATLASREAYEEAASCFEQAAALAGGPGPAHDDARFNHARAMLCLGRFSRGWDDHRFRPSRPAGIEAQRLPADAPGLEVELLGEQGVGDQLFFLRFAPLLADRGARVSFSGDKRLAGMAARAGIASARGAAARRIALGDLPWALACGDRDIPAPLGLEPLGERARLVASLLASLPRPIIGVAWRAGGVVGSDDTTKQVPPTRLGLALRGIAGSVVSVQRQPRPGELASFSAGLGRQAADLSRANDDLETMLAVMAALDFHAGVSSANVHLRCGAGRGSDILVPFPMDWRWRSEADGSVPWYPGCVAYRQGRDGDWSVPLEALGNSLRDRAR